MRISVAVALALVLLIAAGPAHADFADAYNQIGAYEDAIVQRVTQVVTGPELRHVVTVLYFVMALALFVLKCTGWALRGFRLDQFFETLMHIMLTGAMLTAFTTVVPAIFNATLYVGQEMLNGIAGVADTSLPRAMVDMLANYGKDLKPQCELSGNPLHWLDCLTGRLVAIFAAAYMAIVVALLCMAIMFVDIWGFWLYAIALAIGPVLVPFTLYERLQFLFNGWLRFFFGMVIYVILARINFALVAVALLTYLRKSAQEVISGVLDLPGHPTQVQAFSDILGMSVFAFVGICTLLATGRFASAIVAGAAGGGVNFGNIANKAVTQVNNKVKAYRTRNENNKKTKKDKDKQDGKTDKNQPRTVWGPGKATARATAFGDGTPKPRSSVWNKLTGTRVMQDTKTDPHARALRIERDVRNWERQADARDARAARWSAQEKEQIGEAHGKLHEKYADKIREDGARAGASQAAIQLQLDHLARRPGPQLKEEMAAASKDVKAAIREAKAKEAQARGIAKEAQQIKQTAWRNEERRARADGRNMDGKAIDAEIRIETEEMMQRREAVRALEDARRQAAARDDKKGHG